MELTLLLPQPDAARLQRLPFIKASRTGRTRSTAMRIVWHDSLDRALAAQGLALSEQRGVWRLERHRPISTEPWPPATDHRVVLEADGLETMRETLAGDDSLVRPDALPDMLTPVAAFAGRQITSLVTIDTEPVTISVLDGVLRAVAAEQPATRLVLNGPYQQVLSLLLALSEAMPISIPPRSLAAEALNLVDGSPHVARRRGAPALPADGLTVQGAFAHIVGHLTDVMLQLAPAIADATTGPEPVHQMRVAVRRARSAFALFPAPPDSPCHARAAEGLKRLGQTLGPARDWDVFMTETAPPVEVVLPNQPPVHALLRAGARQRRAARESLIAFMTGSEFRSLSLELAFLAAAELPETVPLGLNEFAAGVLRKRWRKVLHVGKALDDLDDPALHGLRLKAKRLRYAAEFFAPLFPEKPAARFIRRLAVLQERLGQFNDTTVAEALLRDLGGKPGYAAGLILGFTAARGVRARPKISSAWSRFRRRDPFWE